MESHKIMVSLALFAVVALAVNGAAIDTQLPAETQPQEKSEQANSAEQVPQTNNEHAREKKWAYAYGYGLTYPAPAAVAYSALPYYAAPAPAYRALPAYYPPAVPTAYSYII